jgi:hypothetical protein
VSNDGDGSIDTADPDCANANDTVEAPAPACADGHDNDGDGDRDYPADPGCHSANDDDEVDPAFSTPNIPPRLLFVMDTSGSMNWNVCASEPLVAAGFTGGDGSSECAGADVSTAACPGGTSGNGMADDSRLYKVKNGVADVIAAFGEVEYAMMRFFQRPVTPFTCPNSSPSNRSGAWQGAGGIARAPPVSAPASTTPRCW